MLRARLTGISALCFTVFVAIAQKDGRPAATMGVAPPLAMGGVPVTVSVPAGSFVMGADAVTLPASVTKGFGVMSTRPERATSTKSPRILFASRMPSKCRSQRSVRPNFDFSIRPICPVKPHPPTPQASVGIRQRPTVPGSRRKPASLASAHRG